MKTYRYKARDRFGNATSGLMAADGEAAVASRLRVMDCVPVSIQATGTIDRLLNGGGVSGRIRNTDVRLCTEQLAALQKAGIPIVMSLRTIHDGMRDRNFKEIIAGIIRDIEAGASLSQSLGVYPSVFKPLYVNVVKSGEASGTLAEGLERLSSLSAYEERIEMRIKAATRYPLTVLAAALIGFVILTVAVVPRFANLYAQSAAVLPLPTRMLLFINKALTSAWWFLIACAGGLFFLGRAYLRSPKGRVIWDRVKLRIPIWGPLELKLAMSRFTRIAGALIKSGVNFFDVLDLAAQGAGNAVVSATISGLKISVSQGKGISGPLKASGVFPPIVTQMIAMGEQTGKLDDVLARLSSYFDSQVEYTVDNLTSMIEPVLIFVLGCIVLGMALGIFLPIWNLSHVFGLPS
jgi:type II secretory pathway component PulF